jgi:outer membrane protein assembly factor BamB
MAANAWYRSGIGLFLTSVVLPPIAIVLVWLQPARGLFRKSLRTLALCFWTVILTGLLLARFAGLQVEVDGTGTRPVFSFYNPDSHYDEMERLRAVQEILSPLEPVANGNGEPVDEGVSLAATVIGESDSLDTPGGRNYWTDFRGPKRDGCYRQSPILTDWPGGKLDELWRQKIGENYASVVVADGRVFTIEQRRDREVVACYDFKTGVEVWEHGWTAQFSESMGGDGPRATPTWHDGKIYALGATGELQAIHAKKGKSIWRRNILTENGARNLTWAMSASPLVVDDKVIVLPGGENGKSVVAYHKDTGEPVWSVLDDQQAYTSPSLATIGGERQILVVSARRLMGLRPEDGALLWDFP